MALINKDGKVIANASQTIVAFNTEAEYNYWFASLPNGEEDLAKFYIIKNYKKVRGAYIEVNTMADLMGLPDNQKIQGCLYLVSALNKFYRYDDENFVSISFGGDAVWEAGTGDHSVQTVQAEVDKNNAAGKASVAEGGATDAHADYSHAEGYMTSTGTDANYSHTEGYKTSTQGVASHAEGDNTVTNNQAEHAEGKYNKSNMGGTEATNTLSSIGIGNGSGEIPGGERKNAFEVMQNGDIYIKGVGAYDGKNATSEDVQTLQEIISSLLERITTLESAM